MTIPDRSLVLPGAPESVREGRLFARDVVREWGLAALVDDVQLATSELLTNAVRHAGTDIRLTLRLADRLVVEVQDADPRLPRQLPGVGAFAAAGRGLHIVAAISADWGIRRMPGGKAVWFALQLPDVVGTDATVRTFSDRRRVDARVDDGDGPAGTRDDVEARAAG
jgi:anti-sigma regulatory factor (Ser/Thr protein kinase)